MIENIHEIDPGRLLRLGAYDEDGNEVCCGNCGGELEFDDIFQCWRCKDCDWEIDRSEWFNYIGAERVPGELCYSTCECNYPICKLLYCVDYKIPEDDPIVR